MAQSRGARTVLAQLLDYASKLSCWGFEDLQREAAAASGKGHEHIMACVRETDSSIDEASFVDGINRSLKTGDFLLLIVGDGIRTGAESLVGFVQQYGSLRFGLGLIEVAAYRWGPDEILLQPRILAKTEVIKRTVIVGGNNQPLQEVAPETDEPPEASSQQSEWFQGFWSEYKSALSLDDTTQPLPAKLPRSTNFYLPMPPSGSAAWLSAFLVQSQRKEAGVYLSFAKAFEAAGDIYEKLIGEREAIERSAGTVSRWERDADRGKIWISVPSETFND